MATSDAKPGDVVELKDKEGGFTDPETGFDISRDQKMELGDSIGRATHEALVSGGLLVVKGKSAKSEAAADAKAEEKATDAAAEVAGREAVVSTGKKSSKK